MVPYRSSDHDTGRGGQAQQVGSIEIAPKKLPFHRAILYNPEGLEFVEAVGRGGNLFSVRRDGGGWHIKTWGRIGDHILEPQDHAGSGSGSKEGCYAAPEMIGTSPVFGELRRRLSAVAGRRCTVLIGGETGTGKELVARNIHALSPRASGPFVPVDCAALPEALIESQMFGHVRGAFTGAQQSTLGFIRSADGGTLFLDEIGELPASAQAKLLRCLQERQVVPVGATRPIGVDIRVIAATHRDLLAMVGTGEFREDLYYRLNVATLTTPPLRERRDDVGVLALHFVHDLAELYGEPPKAIDPKAIEVMTSYGWPGNIRELCNAVEHAFILCVGPTIFTRDLPKVIAETRPEKPHEPVVMPLAQAERELISRALAVTNGNQTQAARLIGVERHRLRRMVVRHGLEAMTRPRPN